MEKEVVLEKVYWTAFDYELKYRGCAQCSLAALQDVFEIQEAPVFKSATGLSGGVGLSLLGSCGALTGGAMAISQLFGRGREAFDDPERKRAVAYELSDRLAKRFVQEYGSVLCGEIQQKFLGRSYDLWDKEGYAEFERVAYSHQGGCPEVVARGAVWAAEIILEEMERRGEPVEKVD